ncbi:hypothetical protein FHR85_001920 [Alkalibacillus almallahensis]|nr:hypothetical protein [Alkalibacillus almallahensis]
MQVLVDGVSRLIDQEVINVDLEEFNYYLNSMLTELENENVSTVCDILYFEINPLLIEMKEEM